MTSFFDQIKTAILQKIGEGKVELLDPRSDGRHLEVIVVSDIFQDLTLLERHRLVMEAVQTFFEESLHALSIKTYTFSEIEG